jgi:hypothetical protein
MAVPRIHRVYLQQYVRSLSKVLLLYNKLEIQWEAEMTNILGTLDDIIIFYQSDRCLADLRH